MEVLRLKIKSAAGSKQILLLTGSGTAPKLSNREIVAQYAKKPKQ